MKREIKFRAWDNFLKKMGKCNKHFELTEDLNSQLQDVVLLQYTGLLDKNGKEIYEGDIICWVDEVAVEEIEGHIRYED